MEDENRHFTVFHAISMIITLFLLFLFIFLLAITMNYIKNIAFTIKTILRAAFESKSPFLAYKADVDKIKHTEIRTEVETNMKLIEKEEWYFVRYTLI